MENQEDILDALNLYEKKPSKDIPPLLEDFLRQVAKTGETIYPWTRLKKLFVNKLDQVMLKFNEDTPFDHLSPFPNVDHPKFDEMRARVLEAIERFHGAPFTVQRICELVTDPRKHYTRTDKFLRGIEKNVLVVSTVDPFGRKIVSEPRTMMNGLDVNGLNGSKGEEMQVADSPSFLPTAPKPQLPSNWSNNNASVWPSPPKPIESDDHPEPMSDPQPKPADVNLLSDETLSSRVPGGITLESEASLASEETSGKALNTVSSEDVQEGVNQSGEKSEAENQSSAQAQPESAEPSQSEDEKIVEKQTDRESAGSLSPTQEAVSSTQESLVPVLEVEKTESDTLSHEVPEPSNTETEQIPSTSQGEEGPAHTEPTKEEQTPAGQSELRETPSTGYREVPTADTEETEKATTEPEEQEKHTSLEESGVCTEGQPVDTDQQHTRVHSDQQEQQSTEVTGSSDTEGSRTTDTDVTQPVEDRVDPEPDLEPCPAEPSSAAVTGQDSEADVVTETNNNETIPTLPDNEAQSQETLQAEAQSASALLDNEEANQMDTVKPCDVAGPVAAGGMGGEAVEADCATSTTTTTVCPVEGDSSCESSDVTTMVQESSDTSESMEVDSDKVAEAGRTMDSQVSTTLTSDAVDEPMDQE